MVGLGSGHLAALHRGLLVVLTAAVLLLLPAIIFGGASGPAWMERRGEPALGDLPDPAPQSDEQPASRSAIDWSGGSRTQQ